MKAKSIKGNSTEEIKAALIQSIADGYQPTLAIVFISIKQDRKAVVELLQQFGIDVFELHHAASSLTAIKAREKLLFFYLILIESIMQLILKMCKMIR